MTASLWASNCEFLLDYLEKKQSELHPNDHSMEYQYKTVRLQVERGDARPEERLKALRIILVELSDARFVDCPVDLRVWLRNAQLEAAERHRRAQIKQAKTASLSSQSAETKFEDPAQRLLNSPVHSDDSSVDLNASDLFAISADSTTLASQLRTRHESEQQNATTSRPKSRHRISSRRRKSSGSRSASVRSPAPSTAAETKRDRAESKAGVADLDHVQRSRSRAESKSSHATEKVLVDFPEPIVDDLIVQDKGASEYVKRRPSQILIPSSPTPSRPRKQTIDEDQSRPRKLTIDGGRRLSIGHRANFSRLTRNLSNESSDTADGPPTAHASPSMLTRTTASRRLVARSPGLSGRKDRPESARRSGRRRSLSSAGLTNTSPRIVWQQAESESSGGSATNRRRLSISHRSHFRGSPSASQVGSGQDSRNNRAPSTSVGTAASPASSSRFTPSPRVRRASISGANRVPSHRRRRRSSAEWARDAVELGLYMSPPQHTNQRRSSIENARVLEGKSAGKSRTSTGK